MQIAKEALDELRKTMLVLDFGNKFLNFLLIFASFLLIFNLFDVKWFYSFVPALLYLLVVLVIDFAINIYYKVENKVPEMHEQLRTVADNVEKSNEILDSLKQDVIKNMKKIKTSYFVDFKNLSVRVLILCGLAFIIVILSFLNVNFDFAGFDLGDVNSIGLRNTGQEAVRIGYSLSEGNLEDVLGNKTLAELGTKEFRLEINPLESDADLTLVSAADEEEFSAPDFPKEIYTRYDLAYNEEIAKENQEAIRNYFDAIIGEEDG